MIELHLATKMYSPVPRHAVRVLGTTTGDAVTSTAPQVAHEQDETEKRAAERKRCRPNAARREQSK